jgi:MFS family permease
MEKSHKYPLILLTTICITYFVENFLRMAAGALTPILIEELEISHGSMGLLISAYFFIYGVMQIPSGILSEKFGARKTILVFTAITMGGIFLFWWSRSYNLLFVAQFLVGIGCSTFYINAVRLVRTWFPANRTATAIGILSASSGLGNFVSYMGFPLAVERWGSWRPLYLGMSIILVVNWVMNIFILKDGNGAPENNVKKDEPPITETIIATLKDKRLYPFLAGYMLSTTAWVFMNWMPQFLIDVRGMTYIEVGQIASVGTIAGIPGCILVAAVSDRLKKRKLPLLGFSILATTMLIVFLNLPATTPIFVFSALNFGMGFAYSYWVLYFSMIPETLPPQKASVGLGIVNGLGTIMFSIFAPTYGYFVDITGSYTTSNSLIQGLSLLMPVIFFFFIKECYGGIAEDEITVSTPSPHTFK